MTDRSEPANSIVSHASRMSRLREIDAIAEEFEEAWKRGKEPGIDGFVAKARPELRGDLLEELREIDLEYRRRLSAESARDLAARYRVAPCRGPGVSTTATDSEGRDLSASAPQSGLPAMIGRYPVLDLIATEGQAEVYQGIHPELRVLIAIKWCRSTAGRGIASPERIGKEARALAELRHPGIVRVFDLGVQDDRPFLVMDYVRGANLQQYATSRTVGLTEAVSIVAQVSRALSAAHRNGVLHLDIKPLNILIDEQGQPCLIDFGLALYRSALRADPLASGLIFGSPGYMAPEQARGRTEDLDPRSDVFSLGGVLYFLLTGKDLFQGDTVEERVTRAQNAEFDPAPLHAPTIPIAVREICLRALSFAPEDRYDTCSAFAEALEGFLVSRRGQPPQLHSGRRRWIWPAGVALAIVAITVSALLWPRGGSVLDQESTTSTAELRIRVARGDLWSDFVEFIDKDGRTVVPGDVLRMEVDVAQGKNAALYFWDREAGWKMLRALGADSEDRKLEYPATRGHGALLKPPGGTQVVLLWCGTTSPPTKETLVSVWAPNHEIPDLPQCRLLRLAHGEVEALGGGRGIDLTKTRFVADPIERVIGLLEQLCEALEADGSTVAAYAFLLDEVQ